MAGTATFTNNSAIRGKHKFAGEEVVRDCLDDDPWIHSHLGPCAIGGAVLACMPLPAGLAKADPASPVEGG